MVSGVIFQRPSRSRTPDWSPLMTASVDFLAILVTSATVVATIAPVVLVALWVIDARNGRLW